MKTDYTIIKTSLIIILLCLLNACNMREYCAFKYPAKDSTVTKYNPVLIPIHLATKPNTIILHDSIPCPGIDYERTEENKHQKVTTKIKNGKIETKATCKEDSLNAVIELKDKEINHYKNVPPIIKKIEVTPWWNWVIYGFLVGVILFLIIRILLK